jgi:ElaB/YqjD/DUF883 family membrane-anchored ribosome-binding protein
MKPKDMSDQVAETIQHGRDLYDQALERTRESTQAAETLLRRNAFKVLLGGLAAGFVAGCLCSRACRCHRG